MGISWTIMAAFLIDALIGDPRFIPHPVVMMGKATAQLEKWIRSALKSPSSGQLRAAGVLFPVIIVGGSFFITWLLLFGLSHIHPRVAVAAEVWLISTTIAYKGLKDAGLKIYHILKEGNLQSARQALAMVVGRDTEQLDEKEVTRATVETVSENIVDAVVSPLLFAALGGAPLAMAYRAVNTLDSMVGYKNERYVDLGWISARLDDAANYVPSRIAATILVLVSVWLTRNPFQTLRIIRRDARRHPSPNSGFMEAGVAAALGVQLGGTNYYGGIPSHRAVMGEATRALDREDIVMSVRFLRHVSLISVIVATLITMFYR